MNFKQLYRLLAVWDCRPMPAELSAVWGAFLHEGLMCHPGDPGRTRRILETWDSGCIELIIATCDTWTRSGRPSPTSGSSPWSPWRLRVRSGQRAGRVAG